MNKSQNIIIDKFTEKIVKYNNFVIFYRTNCPYSQNALSLLRKYHQSYKGYSVDNINLANVIGTFKKTSDITDFNASHTTVPIIFYNHKFFGGCTELQSLLEKI